MFCCETWGHYGTQEMSGFHRGQRLVLKIFPLGILINSDEVKLAVLGRLPMPQATCVTALSRLQGQKSPAPRAKATLEGAQDGACESHTAREKALLWRPRGKPQTTGRSLCPLVQGQLPGDWKWNRAVGPRSQQDMGLWPVWLQTRPRRRQWISALNHRGPRALRLVVSQGPSGCPTRDLVFYLS